jgi:hypothetical protein
MRSGARHLPLILLALLVTIVLVSPGCQGSSTVTGPSSGAAAAASIDGTWSGTFQAYDPAGCGSSSATATFHQNGATVTGIVSTSSCGVTGAFKGTVQGNLVTGAIAMMGCVGGGASGTVSGTQFELTIGDLTKPLVTGDKTVMYGGLVTFHR